MRALLLFDISGGEFLLIIIAVVMFFGTKSIPDMARGLGRAMREFKDATNHIKREISDSANRVESEIGKVVPGDMSKWIEEDVQEVKPDQPVIRPVEKPGIIEDFAEESGEPDALQDEPKPSEDKTKSPEEPS
jgi:sec-independent protein translocase protein TatA